MLGPSARLDQLPPSAAGPEGDGLYGLGRYRQDASTASGPGEGLLDMEPGGLGADCSSTDGGPSDFLNLQGPDRQKPTLTVWFLGRHWSSPSLTFLICNMGLLSSPASPWTVRGWEQRVTATLTFTPSLGAQRRDAPADFMALSLSYTQTERLLLPVLRQVTAPSLTQFPQL